MSAETKSPDPVDMSDMEFSGMTAYELIDALDSAFPHMCARLGQTIESIHHYAGRRALIDELIAAKGAEIEDKIETLIAKSSVSG